MILQTSYLFQDAGLKQCITDVLIYATYISIEKKEGFWLNYILVRFNPFKILVTQNWNCSNSYLLKRYGLNLKDLKKFPEMCLRKHQTYVHHQLKQRRCFLQEEIGQVNNNRAACHTTVLCNWQASTKFGKCCLCSWMRVNKDTQKVIFKPHLLFVFRPCSKLAFRLIEQCQQIY